MERVFRRVMGLGLLTKRSQAGPNNLLWRHPKAVLRQGIRPVFSTEKFMEE